MWCRWIITQPDVALLEPFAPVDPREAYRVEAALSEQSG